MPRDPAAALGALLQAATIADHDEMLRTANATLKANKRDELAQHTKVVALLKLDRFDDAICAISDGDAKLQARCLLEKAYALYKMGKLDEATAALKSAGMDGRSFSHVAAQVSYRAEKFREAEAIYRRLNIDGAHETSDIGINIKAAQAQSEWQGGMASPSFFSNPPPEIFELCYNAACAHIARASFQTAAHLLQRAAKLCDASDDLTEEEKVVELKPIMAQQAYVYARLGDSRKALDLSRSLDMLSHVDSDFALLVQNNKFALEAQASNPFVLQREAAASMSSAAKRKLFSYQYSALTRNSYLADLQAHKVDGVGHRTRNILDAERYSTTDLNVNVASVINAAAQTSGLSGKQLLRRVVTLSEKRLHSVGLIITVVQLYVRQNSLGAALAVLESFLDRLENSSEYEHRDVRFSPGLVALAVSLMRAVRKERSAKAELVKATEYWRHRPVSSASSLLREAGVHLARSSSPADLSLAVSAFKKLHDEKQRSPVVSAGLVAALAASDIGQVQQHMAELPPVDGLIKGINVNLLINKGVATRDTCTSAKRPAPDGATDERATKKCRKRRRLPKNVVEGKAPDPERWLPLRDRSAYRPRGKKGKKRVAESTQGGIVRDEETLGLVGGGGVKVEKTPAAGSTKKKGKKGNGSLAFACLPTATKKTQN